MQADDIHYRLGAALALDAIERSPVPTRLAAHRAVVLERWAGGAGATRWYLIERPVDLSALTTRLRPGSLVSFYFDDRIQEVYVAEEEKAAILAIAAADRDAVVATRTDTVQLRVDFVSNASELEAFLATLSEGETLFFGRFPGSDNDGRIAVTITLPDEDGTVRPHPY